MKKLISGLTAVCMLICFMSFFSMYFSAVSLDDFIKEVYVSSDDENEMKLPYRLLVPENYNEETKYPLVLFLHGAGECGTGNEAQLKNTYTIADTLIQGDFPEKYPCFILAPQCASSWLYYCEIVMELILDLSQQYSIDMERLYITGLSLGGFGTFYMLRAFPDTFAAAVPICGGTYDTSVSALLNTPIWVFHGEKDPTVSVESSRNIVNAIRNAGGTNIKYTEFPKADHGIWGMTYKINELYEWMFAQRLGQSMVSVDTITDVFDDVGIGSWYYEPIKYVYFNGLFKGVSEDKFMPNAYMTRAMFVTVMHRFEGEGEVSDDSINFTDVPEGKWYTAAVKWANENGIVKGKSETVFAPDEPITREQIVTMMYRYAEHCSMDMSGRADITEFTDSYMIAEYAKDAVSWAAYEKLIEGKGLKRIAPKENARRSEAAAILIRFSEIEQ